MSGTVILKGPIDCTGGERREFARLVRRGFEGSTGRLRARAGLGVRRPRPPGTRIAESLCRRLLAQVPASRVFATTRPDNPFMIRILQALGFSPAGKPYPRRGEELALFLRSRPAGVAPGPAP